MVSVLEGKGITAPEVLRALMAVPRHLFIDDSALHQHAYEDKAFPIGCGQTISQPYTVAFQTQLLEVRKGDKVLEIGTGSGYQTAVLSVLGTRVRSIERHKPLYLQTKDRLQRLGYKAELTYGDGFAGAPTFAPFDRVLVTCGAPFIPPALIEQLRPGGILVIPVGEGDVQRMFRMIKGLDGRIHHEDHGDFRFVPMLAAKQ
ncbi:MAG: protein-L-isoaspartate(D-aspartate) O-methyltransferase [Flavobacteriales bacterium]|nr:protein-L-isoaspartate(D-aspartate) O-methyltransferase [Flavobacteriales bacterium]